MKRSLILTALSFLVLAQFGWGQVPQTISYQGVLRDAATDAPLEGAHSITFSLYDAATAATPAWSENQTVTITDGVFSVVLGQEAANVLPYPFTSPAWLGIQVGADAELPRIELTSVPYALQAAELNMPATERWCSIPGPEFRAYYGSANTDSINLYLYSTGTGYYNRVSAGVHLPHGAMITDFQARVLDYSTDHTDSASFSIELWKLTAGNAPTSLSSITTTSLSSAIQIKPGSSVNHQVDNQYNTYLVTARWRAPYTYQNLKLYDVSIRYTVNQPLP